MSVFDQYLCQLVCRSGIFHLYAVKQLIFIMIMDKKRRYVVLSNFSEQADIWIGKRDREPSIINPETLLFISPSDKVPHHSDGFWLPQPQSHIPFLSTQIQFHHTPAEINNRNNNPRSRPTR